MERRKDMFGIEPIIGDTVVFNPPHYKGLVAATVVDFAKSGLPQVVREEDYLDYLQELEEDKVGYYETPKTGFVIKR